MARGAVVLALVAVSACTVPGPGDVENGIFDPYEDANRARHERGKRSDTRFLRPVAMAYVDAVTEGVQTNVSNLADTASLPKTVVNQVLQGRLGDATRNTVRFAINATLGFAGLADVASDMGLPRDKSDFGETLFVWGLPEGAYLELPLLGPSTERDAAGEVVDLFLNPFGAIVPAPERYVYTVAKVGDTLTERGRFAGTVDSILYESADSYSQLRLIYLQNRRFELGDDTAMSAEDEDPFALDTEGF
ncbi:VacJ family lipoprotein [Aestuariicoccus sp. MJ-SS9]|uniref:MlaA family lipoprotein n=1 Tax=Aestuariicoccus sp. MJ-SS9 TaxID=3079855 RepID=UPI0029121E8A|nr:VacJ family lipoprotein [Aestuariicoccus sp. MJ-SS9]MDU8912610.1 VacJ family lipoprotein [Aestuariicoccus sp. MJ-SS9]